MGGSQNSQGMVLLGCCYCSRRLKTEDTSVSACNHHVSHTNLVLQYCGLQGPKPEDYLKD